MTLDPTPIPLLPHTGSLWLLVLPLLLAFLGLLALGSRAHRWAGGITTGALLLSAVGFLMLFWQHRIDFYRDFVPFRIQGLLWRGIDFPGPLKQLFAGPGVSLDNYTLLMLGVVLAIAVLVSLFSVGYMQHDGRKHRYFAYLSFFVFAMLGLILSHHLVQLFIFWELVGVASYLLIGFWYQKPTAAEAAKKAFIVNRIGDVCLLAAIALMHGQGMPLTLNGLAAFAGDADATVAILLVLGVLGKSAQFPLQVWLPDAMQGPTPVSALIHAATMVVAGVYLLIRVSPLLGPALPLVGWIGGITALLGALSALNQTDIKKVLAYSTISQLGFMVLGIGAGAPEAAFFHLATHAFFKAGLFLAAGAIIHYLHQQQHAGVFPKNLDVQSFAAMGGLHKRLPLVSLAFAACGLALAGIPLFSGYLSKEAILGSAWGQTPAVYLALAAAVLTPLYIARAYKLAFLRAQHPELAQQGPALPRGMALIPALLGLFSLAVWFGPNLFHPSDSWILYRLGTQLPHGPAWMAPVLIALSVIGIAMVLWVRKRPGRTSLFDPSQPLGGFLFHHFYLDRLYLGVLVPTMQVVGRGTDWLDAHLIDPILHILSRGQVVLAQGIRFVDQYGVDGIVNGLARVARWGGRLLSNPASGQAQTYLLRALAALVLILALLILW